MSSRRLPLIFTILAGLISVQNATAGENIEERVLADPAVNRIIGNSLKHLQAQTIKKGRGSYSVSQELGFDSADPIESAVVGQGFPMYFVELEKLKRYAKGADPWPLLNATSTIIFPLSVAKDNEYKTRSAVTVAYQRDKDVFTPRIVEIGNAVLIRLLVEARVQLQKEGRCNQPSECFVVAVPALDLYLFGYRNVGTKELQMLVLNQVLGHVKKADLRSAREVIENLSNEARTGKYEIPDDFPDKKKQFKPPLPIRGEKTNATMY